jgi:hypothetical protein
MTANANGPEIGNRDDLEEPGQRRQQERAGGAHGRHVLLARYLARSIL